MLYRLAWGNVRRAGRDYLIYLLTLMLGVTVFYAFNTIGQQMEYAGMDASLAQTLSDTIFALTIALAAVMGFLMVYANNFIMRRRKLEFGLYQILGMGRGEVATVMALETAFVSASALLIGLVCGVGLSQLMTFFTASLFRTQIANFHFFFSTDAFVLTLLCLAAIFAVTLLFNLRAVSRSKAIDLMSAQRANESVRVRGPWVSAFAFIAGVALVGIAYSRLLRDGIPLSPDVDIKPFWITTAIVIVGTFLLFFGLSGLLLKALQALRNVYWRGLNMFTLRQLASKVNTVSVSMAVISLILFLAITSVTTGMSIAGIMVEGVERGCPADFSATVFYPHSQPTASAPIDVLAAISPSDQAERDNAETLASIAGTHVQVNIYDIKPDEASQPYASFATFASEAGAELPEGISEQQAAQLPLVVMRESDYNRYLEFRGLSRISLGTDGYLIACDLGESVNDVYDKALSEGVTLDFGGHKLRPAASSVNTNASTFVNGPMGSNQGTIVVPDAVVDACNLPLTTSFLLLDYADGVSTEQGDAVADKEDPSDGSVKLFDVEGDETIKILLMRTTRTNVYKSTDTTNGLISYLAIYIGFVLVVACGAILAIQQLSGVADSGPSYRLLSELGADESSLRGSLLVQQAVFFALPLAVGVSHACVALHVVIDTIAMLGGLSIDGAAWLACLIFVAAYGGYFVLTYLMGANLMSRAVRTRKAA